LTGAAIIGLFTVNMAITELVKMLNNPKTWSSLSPNWDYSRCKIL